MRWTHATFLVWLCRQTTNKLKPSPFRHRRANNQRGGGGGLGEQAEGGEVLGPDAEAGPEVVVPLLAVVFHPDHREQEVLRVRGGALQKDPPGGGGPCQGGG